MTVAAASEMKNLAQDRNISGIEGDEGLLWYSDHSGVIGAPA